MAHTFRLLASDDLATSCVAAASLRNVVRKKILRDPTPGECADFLNGKKVDEFARGSGDQFLQWTPSTADLFTRLLRDDLKRYFISQLSGFVEQGKTAEGFSQHPASNHFLQAGDFPRFCEWNFIHRARLGCLQLNGTVHFSKRKPRCLKWGYARVMIPHVFNHYLMYFTLFFHVLMPVADGPIGLVTEPPLSRPQELWLRSVPLRLSACGSFSREVLLTAAADLDLLCLRS
ncbi:reverse transcriptase domain-containing protein [Nephila pilipes]|uniref:Reverse transcriptase domain-containing protein n=1 Tax=Nephila pilipes TaxID=299642 RepID=A0A8X6M7F4_NEPPI|nr:reverse transcriptase domain-containing protein [Nephila pilipes]